MRCQIIAECCTNHGGDLELAKTMIAAAADAGADICKFQSYQTKYLSPADPQYAWLKQCELSDEAHDVLMRECEQRGVQFLTTVFNEDNLARARQLGVQRFKIGHAESGQAWWWHWQYSGLRPMFVSWPWGKQKHPYALDALSDVTHLAVVPLYPTPLEALVALTLLDGYSDHAEGVDACKWALANGAKVIEKHFSLPGHGRNQPWDMTPNGLRELRESADTMAVIHSGTRHEGRWTFKTA